MALIELSMITSMILEMGVDAAKKNLGRRETVISILKRLNLEVAPAADDFDAIYVYTLVEYGVDKPEPILNFFRNEFIQKAFRKSFYENNPSVLEKEAEGIIEWSEETRQLGYIDYDPRNEFASFTAVFNQIVDNLRSPAEVKRDQKINDVHENTEEIIKKLNKANNLDAIREVIRQEFATLNQVTEIVLRSEKEKNKRKYELRNKHEFQAPRYYKVVQDTAVEFQRKLEELKGGYLGVFGPPGSGKSTFLTQTLRTLPIRSIRYYAYVPDAQDPSVLRGESINFFHDTTLQIQRLRNSHEERPDPTDRIALNQFFHQQLILLGKDYEETSTRTIILVDGLDHIAREQHPDRSLIEDLPLPDTLPEGVYLVVGSQTKELTNLPATIQNALSKKERTIWMGKLSPQNVFEIIHQTLSEISNSFDSKIYEIVDGHPLSLIYLLNSLFLSKSPDEYAEILEGTMSYSGNIEDQYFAHWKKIEDDLDFSDFLGLLARIRGPIPIKWIAGWPITTRELLKKLDRMFGQYFSSDSLERWEFFHNSFRIFLEARTADGLPGRTSEEINQEFHLKLAQLYENSDDPYKWETLYHYYRAGEHRRVIDIAQYIWFRSQAETLRPIDAIETDVRLATKSAGELLDTLAIVRYTLIGASLQQRSYALKDSQLPQLLIEAGRSDLAIDYARDGARLRLEDKTALSVSRNLVEINHQEAVRIFELAEPLEYLSGRLIAEKNVQSNALHDLLSEWVESASLIRSPFEVTQTVRRIQIEPLWKDENKNIAQESLDLQNWLLYIGALSCCEREDWKGWKIYFEALDAKRDSQRRYFTLLHTIVRLRQNKMKDRARQLLMELLEMDQPTSFGSGRNKTANLLSVAEAVYFLKIDNDKTLAKFWFEKIDIVPLSDKELSYTDNSPKLINLHFRYARMKFALDSNITPNQLIKEAERQTTFEEYDDNETRLARRQIALIAITLAKLWIEGHAENIKEPDVFLSKTRWIFDLIESGWQGSSATFRIQTEGAKEDISEYLVVCAAKHGKATLQTIKNEFSLHWKNESKVWSAGIQRNITLAIADYDIDYDWAKNQLERIEIFMSNGLDLYSRVKECEDQAKAWLQIGERQIAISTLLQLVKCARGIYSEKDYQLSHWASWIRKTTRLLDYTQSTAIIEKFLRQALSVEDTTSRVDDALVSALQVVFDISPHKSILLYKKLLEQKSITYDEGLIYLLLSALESEKPPLMEVYWIMGELLLPFTRSTSSKLITSFIAKTNLIQGNEKALELSRSLAEKITTDVQENHRADWIDGIHEELTRIGINPKIIGVPRILVEETNSNNSTDYKLHLLTGESFSLQDAILATSTIDDFRSLLEKEKRQSGNYFEWYKLAISLIDKLVEIEKIREICSLMENRSDGYSEHYLVRVYTKASEKSYQLGNIDYSKQTIQKALSLTNPSGWSAYYDGGAKYDAMFQAIKLLGGDFRNELIKLYVQDLSERYRYPEQLIRDLDEIAQVLFEDIPYLSIWPDIENYLDELFGGIVVEAQPELEVILESPVEVIIDNASSALAELLMLYLDLPAFPVFDGAIRACAKLILADSSAVKNAVKLALKKHDQLVRQAVIAIEIMSLQEPNGVSFFQDELTELSTSPNMILRMIATKALINSSGQSLIPPKSKRSLPVIYTLHLPDIALHKTEYSLEKDSEPVLLRDPALLLQPFDVEAQEIARKAGVPENNLLYHAAEKLKEIEIQRTWLFNGLALKPKELAFFLDKINLNISHNKPKIFPCKNTIAHITAELYDADKLSFSDLAFLDFMFRDYDPNLFLIKSSPRPYYIETLGGLPINLGAFLDLPKDWDKTHANSLPLLKSQSSDERIILAEWTHLRRLQREWPSEERLSLVRAVAPYKIWDDIDLTQERLPFANAIRLYASGYLEIKEYPEKELVIAHNGYEYQMGQANWLSLNPRVGFDLGWQPVYEKLFAWKDKNDQLAVESIYWQDGNFNSASWSDHAEVGYGWIVLVTESGYQEIRRRYGVISRGGVIKRGLGQFGIDRKTISSVLDLA